MVNRWVSRFATDEVHVYWSTCLYLSSLLHLPWLKRSWKPCFPSQVKTHQRITGGDIFAFSATLVVDRYHPLAGEVQPQQPPIPAKGYHGQGSPWQRQRLATVFGSHPSFLKINTWYHSQFWRLTPFLGLKAIPLRDGTSRSAAPWWIAPWAISLLAWRSWSSGL